MGCVNTASRAFKFLAERNDLDVNTLELITHKYWLETGNENYFPSDVYIQAQKGVGKYQESIQEVRDLWRKDYNKPTKYPNADQLNIAKQEALKYFPASAISYYKDFNGNYVLSVKEPVEAYTPSIKDYTEKSKYSDQERADYNLIQNHTLYYENESKITANQSQDGVDSRLNELIKNNIQEITSEQLIDMVSENSDYANIVDALKKILKDSNDQSALTDFKVKVVNPLMRGGYPYAYGGVFRTKRAFYDAKEKTIFVDGLASFKNKDASSVLLHEVMHHITLNKLASNKEAREALQNILNEYHANKPYVQTTGKHVLEEFVADIWSNPTVINDLKSIEVKGETLWDKFKKFLGNIVNGLFGKADKTLLGKASDELIKLLESPVTTSVEEGTYAENEAKTFTFEDGTIVTAPFTPNYQQVDALNAMSRFINSSETSMTLSGYAGTGKTSLMEMLAQKMRKQYKPVMFCATTNKAAAVLNSRVSKSGFEAQTLNKVFGISVEVDTKQAAYNAKNLVNVLKGVDITPGTTVIIDEASMINEENYRVLNDIAQEYGLKIIYVGDEAQLAPVNETQISKVFRVNEGNIRRLTIVERTDDNAILKEATDLRNNKPLSGESSFNEQGKGVAYISATNQKSKEDIIKHYIQGLKTDPNYFRILAYTNAAVSGYNSLVRNLLGYTTPTPRVNEPMVGYANWGYVYEKNGKGHYKFINSESYNVVRVESPVSRYTTLPNGERVVMEATPITLVDSMGNEQQFEFMDVKNNPQNRETALRLTQAKEELWNKARTLPKAQKAPILQQINFIESFLFINDDIKIGERVVQAKVIDYGYAMTVHKSQGSTFTNVLMDDVDIQKANGSMNNAADALTMVDLGTPTAFDYNKSELTAEEDVDLGALDDVLIQEAPKSQPMQNVANVRQQLRYVGVSRATNTVSIISNDVKKEDSPLNHIKDAEVSKTQPVPSSTESAKTTINIYAGTGENVELSNFANRPFTLPAEFRLPNGIVFSRNPLSFNSVEQAFQLAKLAFTETPFRSDAHKRNNEIHKALLNAESGTEAKRLGRSVQGLKTEEWDKHSSDIMKTFIKASFEQNPEALQRLLNTGDATLTHTQDKGKWGKEFPRLLMEVREELRKQTPDLSTAKSTLTDKNQISETAVQKHQGNWSRQEASNNPRVLYIFTDNTDRDSGSGVIPADSWYSKKYGEGHHFPTMTAAVVRGLENARPISTQRWYHQGAKGTTGRWTDADIADFKQTVREELEEIVREFNTGKYDTIMFPDGDGLFNTNISNITKARTPQLYQALADLLHEYGFDSLVPKDAVLPSQQIETVSLPNYQYFMDRYEDTKVNATWKIDRLKELDNQLDMNSSYDENAAIIETMTKILEADSEASLLQSVPETTPQKKQVTENLTEFEKLNLQINNLLDSNIISATEIRHVAELVVDSISDTITILQTEEGAAEKFFPTLKTDLDFLNASRKEIIAAVGINRLIERAKQQFDPEQNDYDYDVMEQAELIVDNWDAIINLASDVFSANEGLGVGKDYDTGGFTLTDAKRSQYDNFNTEDQDADSAQENEKDERDRWQIESRTIDIIDSMSALVRQGIHECYQLDKSGNKVISKWGIPERVNARKAVNSILRWTQGSLSLADMINKLSAKATQNTWVTQLVERLSDQSGKETDFQSQFYSVFAKHFQLYSIVLLENGKYSSIPVNSHPALTEAINSITTQYKIGEHPLFTNKGINSQLLGTDETTYPEANFNLHKALAELGTIQEAVTRGETLEGDLARTAAANLTAVAKVMGYPVTEEMVMDILNSDSLKRMINSLRFIVKDLDTALAAQRRDSKFQYNPFAFGADNSIGGSLRNFLTPLTDALEDTAINAFYDSGKMYQSYVTPSFMTKLMNKFKLEGQEFEDFIMSEYGNSEWFKFSGKNGFDKGWRNEWLRLLAKDPNARKVFDHKVELNFNKHNYMRNMSDAEYSLSLVTEYFAETAQKGQSMVPAWFRVPMMSNKPSSEFIKFLSYRGANYKDEILLGLHNMFLQELSRIQTVRMRNKSKGDPGFITNFDTKGREFNFLPFLNPYLADDAENKKARTILRNENGTISADNERLAKLLQKKIEGLTKMTSAEEAKLDTLVDKVIRQATEDRVQSILSEWENNGIIEAAKNVSGIGENEDIIRANLENFLWNDSFAAKNILQLTVTDIAFYADAEELQKRLAQLHSPGIRGNVAALDYGDPSRGIPGERVSDGKYRTVLIRGLQNFKSDLIANIAAVFDKRIERAPEGQKAQMKALKETLVGLKGIYNSIDVTDGQAYSSPSSYRKKAFIFGKWSKHAEEIYNKLLKGDYNYTDLETAFQPLKPFVYSHLQKNLGVENAPIHNISVPFQAKNSEYLLIMADAILQSAAKEGVTLPKPNILRAIYRVMEETEKRNPTKGIDTVQFDSAIKSGGQGIIDLNDFVNKPGGEEGAYTYMMSQIFKPGTSEYDTDVFVQEASYEDYSLQQEIPEHFKNHSQIHGSQIRMIIPSDLDFYKNPNGDLTAEDNQVYYEWTEPDGTHKKLRADEFRQEYEETIAESVRESIANLASELHFGSVDKKERNIALSKILQREIINSPRYGVDLIQACSVDKKTGEFRIPKGDPIQAKRIEQLINSIIKDRVNKQKIAGGPIVQVSNFGTSRQLNIRFNSKQGGLLMTREEYEKAPQKKEVSQVDKFNAKYGRKSAPSGTLSYEEYVKENQTGIAYFEVFMPIWDNDIFEKFANEDGSIDVAAIEATDPELLKMISYRIPTEDKYSCAPMKVVGFMPREAGDAIMLPYELTAIDDSDFDIDKRYVMRKDIKIKTRSRKEIQQKLFEMASESYLKAHPFQAPEIKESEENERFSKESTIAFKQKEHEAKAKNYIGKQVTLFMDNPEKLRFTDDFMKWLYNNYKRIAYYTEAPTSGKQYRDNKIVDMSWAVLTNEVTADKILNPGGFDPLKKIGYMVTAYKNLDDTHNWEELEAMSISDLKKASYVEKDLTWADTQIQFYKQNAAAASLIGVFAVNKVAHATLESNDILLDIDEVCGRQPFTIAGVTFEGRKYIDPKYDIEGNLIGKSLGMGVSASADAAKTPVLNLMNINMTTVNIYTTLLRLGMPVRDAALFMSQSIIEKVLNEFNRENLNNYEPLSNIIDKYLAEYRQKHSISEGSNIDSEPLTREELIDGLIPDDTQEGVLDYKVLLAFQKIRAIADALRNPTFATRFNSISSAVGPLIVDNLIMEHKMEKFLDANTDAGTHFYNSDGVTVDIQDIFNAHPILKEFSKTVDIAKEMFLDMPTGSVGFRNLLKQLPDGLAEKVYNDKKLLDDLSNFYQSYLLIASEMIDPTHLKNYIDGFPKYFMDQNFKEKYPDNLLIQDIKLNISKKTGRTFLSINITGLDESQKEMYRNAWVDLHKANPELSKRLFEYCFFRAGVGFSPKTFMSLVPTYVKERLINDKNKVTYVDTYRNFPSVVPSLVVDQWVRNNWNNNKLVPKKGGKDTKYLIDYNQGRLIVRNENDLRDLQGVTYMKTRANGQTYLWRLVGTEGEATSEKVYVRVKPLGNNLEYLEMSLSDIKVPISETTQTDEDIKESEIQTSSPAESDAATDVRPLSIPESEQVKNVEAFADAMMKLNPRITKIDALNKIENIKSRQDISIFGDFLSNVYKQMGLELNKEEAIKKFRKMC